MDEAVIKFYRNLLKADFPNSGELEKPSIFIEAVGEKLINCGNTGNYMQLYIRVIDDRISEIKYLCSCEPTANVAVEVLCNLVKGKTLEEASCISEDSFYQSLESHDEKLKQKVRGLMELLNEGIAGFLDPTEGNANPQVIGQENRSKTSWDGMLSS